ncbi:MAG: TonB-dependent receptor [Bacteroidales bacterium]|nr:TonB-dependent receptor [Bacteroidales bacterium]
MKKIILMLMLVLSTGLSAQFYTISGYLTDGKSGESLINASVFDHRSRKGTVSNEYGFFSITLPAGETQLQFTYVGFQTEQRNFTLRKDTVINIRFQESITLQEITVTGHQKITGVQSTQMSAVEVPIAQIKTVPTLFGEADLIKALQLLPGVQAGSEGSTGMYVRGGGPDENLFLLDGIPVYNINHMAGFFSVFNPDAVKNVTLYKGNFPARFGGRLSSVIDVRMNDGNNKEIRGNLSVGIISSKLNIEGPLFSEKTTFNVSARRTYFDILAQPILAAVAKAEQGDGYDGSLSAGYYFYDLNGKISHKFSDTDRLFLSLYMGDDAIYAKFRSRYRETDQLKSTEHGKLDWDWGNIVTSARWNHVINNRLFMNCTLAYTRYRFNLHVGSRSEEIRKNPPSNTYTDYMVGYKSGIEDYTAKVDFDYAPHPDHDVKFGANYTYHTFRPGVSVARNEIKYNNEIIKTDTMIGDKNVFSHETMAYAEDNISLGYALKLNVGLHYSVFNVQRETYHSLQPRISMRWLLNDRLSVKAGYAAMSQYVHLLSNSSVSLPTDLWVPVTKRIEPMRSHQYSAGIFYNFRDLIDFSVEGYYKSMHNLIEYRDGASFLGSTTGWEDKVAMGDGWAYGLEVLAQKSFGKTTGWIGYTWAKAERKFDRPGQEINYGRVFPAKYDRRHDFSLVLSHKFSDRFDLSGTWVISSGNTGTLALQQFEGTSVPGDDYTWQSDLNHISSRNNYRFNPYHRMDIGMNFHKQKTNGVRTWNISIYNLYNNNNPFMVYPSETWEPVPSTNPGQYTEYTSRKVFKQISIFPIMPSLTYSYKW